MERARTSVVRASAFPRNLGILTCPKNLGDADELIRKVIRARGVDLASIASRVSEVLGVKPEEVWAEGKYRRIVEARSLLCYWAVRELGVPTSSLARKLGISIPSVSESVTRGRRIAEAKRFLLI